MKLTAKNHEQVNVLFGKILDAHKDGVVSRNSVVGVLAHILTAAANRDADEVSGWLNNPDTFENWCQSAYKG